MVLSLNTVSQARLQPDGCRRSFYRRHKALKALKARTTATASVDSFQRLGYSFMMLWQDQLVPADTELQNLQSSRRGVKRKRGRSMGAKLAEALSRCCLCCLWAPTKPQGEEEGCYKP
ncbi:hypothetical protein EYF80_018117 [Liparis tanakae]|uniref:Uncharacterized protein n=1 Tax=Liparis tanakae TaxID=230148 RepID=A0A4Z2I2W5_9TELE|nr:hypothetical protein EYF80_018117 [Liparis tanakae]